jgi:hypothetical protein
MIEHPPCSSFRALVALNAKNCLSATANVGNAQQAFTTSYRICDIF